MIIKMKIIKYCKIFHCKKKYFKTIVNSTNQYKPQKFKNYKNTMKI